MDRSVRDSDQQHPVSRNDNYDMYSPSRPNNRFSTRQNDNYNNQDSYYTYAQQQSDNDRPTVDRKFRNIRYEDERERNDIPITNRSRIILDNNPETNRRSNPFDQTQRSPPQINYRINQPRQTYANNPRSLVIDVNITINVGSAGRNPQISATTSQFRPRSPPIRSTAIIDDVRYVDLDIRSPERTARLATDGLIRSSPLKQSTSHTNENNK